MMAKKVCVLYIIDINYYYSHYYCYYYYYYYYIDIIIFLIYIYNIINIITIIIMIIIIMIIIMMIIIIIDIYIYAFIAAINMDPFVCFCTPAPWAFSIPLHYLVGCFMFRPTWNAKC